MMCSKLLRHNPNPSRFDRMMEHVLVKLTGGYTVALRAVLSQRWIVVLLMVASGAGSWWLYTTTKSELAPMEDRGVVLVNVSAPDGSTLQYTGRYIQAIERIASGYKEFDRNFVVAGNPTVA